MSSIPPRISIYDQMYAMYLKITGSETASSAKQDELRGTQGTGASYNPPTGGSGVFGWLSGIFKEIVSGIKLKIGGSDLSSSNPIPIFSVSGTGQGAEAVLGHEWIAEYNCAAVAAKYSKIAFLNPTGSGKKILFFTASGGHSSAATITYHAKKIAGAGSGGITGMTLLTKNEQNIANNTASTMEVYYSNDDALSSNFTVSRAPVTAVYPVVATCVAIVNPVAVLNEGEALLFEHGTVNFGMYIRPLFCEFAPLTLT